MMLVAILQPWHFQGSFQDVWCFVLLLDVITRSPVTSLTSRFRHDPGLSIHAFLNSVPLLSTVCFWGRRPWGLDGRRRRRGNATHFLLTRFPWSQIYIYKQQIKTLKKGREREGRRDGEGWEGREGGRQTGRVSWGESGILWGLIDSILWANDLPGALRRGVGLGGEGGGGMKPACMTLSHSQPPSLLFSFFHLPLNTYPPTRLACSEVWVAVGWLVSGNGGGAVHRFALCLHCHRHSSVEVNLPPNPPPKNTCNELEACF